ncbi:MAG: DNA repair protein RecO [Oligoflexia bacterium]|nr:DNA repair protein RecO [Oligoflexia bacterium]
MSSVNHETKGQGFILRITAAQEADVIVKILSSNGEKISAFAKAGLKSRKRFGGSLQPLFNITYRLTKKSPQQDLYFLEEAHVRHDFKNLRTQLERLTSASYAAELVELCAHEGLENTELYNLFGATLRALDSGLSVEGVLRQFEVKLLSILGWLPGLQKCASCGVEEKELTLNPDQGLVVCRDCGRFPLILTREVAQHILNLLGTSVLENDLDESQAQRIGQITMALLQSHWGHQKPKALQFMASMRRFQKNP